MSLKTFYNNILGAEAKTNENPKFSTNEIEEIDDVEEVELEANGFIPYY